MALKVLISKQNLSYLVREILYFYPNATNTTLNGVFLFLLGCVEKKKIFDPIEFLQFHGALTCSIYTGIPFRAQCTY